MNETQFKMREDKGIGNQIVPIGMCDEIYVREGKDTENRIGPFTPDILISVDLFTCV